TAQLRTKIIFVHVNWSTMPVECYSSRKGKKHKKTLAFKLTFQIFQVIILFFKILNYRNCMYFLLFVFYFIFVTFINKIIIFDFVYIYCFIIFLYYLHLLFIHCMYFYLCH